MWTLPRKRFSTGYILDNEEFNTNITQFSNQTDGGLNEHNWAEECLVGIADDGKCDDDIALTICNMKDAVDPHLAVGSLTLVQHSTSWTPVDGVTKSFVSHGSRALVLISVQVTNTGSPAAAQSGLNFAIGLDGAVQMNCLLGSGDLSNDLKDPGAGITLGTGGVQFDYGTSPSVRARQTKLLISGLLRIPPGSHTIELFARNLFTISNSGTFPPQYVSQSEIIIIEGWQ